MRAVLAGLGSIGRRHLANLRAIEPDAEITVLRHAESGEPLPPGADRVVYSLDAAVATRPDVALVCGPTATHAEPAVRFAAAGAHLFVEKPLAVDLTDARAIVAASEAAGVTLVVGYNLPFLPAFQALHGALNAGRIGRPMSLRAEVGQYLPDWRPGTDYRRTNSARSFGGGVVLELSHEIDYARRLLGNVRAVDAAIARLGDLDIEVDDTAELLLHFASGAIGSVHLDMTQRAATRSCRIAGTAGTLTWDGSADEVRLYRPADGWTTLHAPDGADRNAMYVDELTHFLACVRGAAESGASGTDGVRVIEIALAAGRASAEGRRIEL